MVINILASGSSGNVAAVRSEKTFFLIDCGKPFNWIMNRLNYDLPNAIILTHEHSDHAKAVRPFLNHHVDFYMTEGTQRALNLEPQHNLHTISHHKVFWLGDIMITPFAVRHDAAEPVSFVLKDDVDLVLFVTDTGSPFLLGGDFTQIFIEANYSKALLYNSTIDAKQKQRIEDNHLSIEEVAQFLRPYQHADVTLLHISKRHGDAAAFYKFLGRNSK